MSSTSIEITVSNTGIPPGIISDTNPSTVTDKGLMAYIASVVF